MKNEIMNAMINTLAVNVCTTPELIAIEIKRLNTLDPKEIEEIFNELKRRETSEKV